MGRNDSRHSVKMRKRVAQKKKKARDKAKKAGSAAKPKS